MPKPFATKIAKGFVVVFCFLLTTIHFPPSTIHHPPSTIHHPLLQIHLRKIESLTVGRLIKSLQQRINVGRDLAKDRNGPIEANFDLFAVIEHLRETPDGHRSDQAQSVNVEVVAMEDSGPHGTGAERRVPSVS